MADFGAMFDAAKASAEEKAQDYRNQAQESRGKRDAAFAAAMNPLNEVVRPILEQSRAELATRGVEVLIDFDDAYNTLDGKRDIRIHFQLMYNSYRSHVYVFRIVNGILSCSADDGSKKLVGQQMGVTSCNAQNISPTIIDLAIERAIGNIMGTITHEAFVESFPPDASETRVKGVWD